MWFFVFFRGFPFFRRFSCFSFCARGWHCVTVGSAFGPLCCAPRAVMRTWVPIRYLADARQSATKGADTTTTTTTRFTSGVFCDVIVQFNGMKAAQICPKHHPQVKPQNPQNTKIGRDSVPPRASARPTGAKLLSYVGLRSPAEFGKRSCGGCSAGSSPTHHGSTPWAAAPMCAAFLL